MARASSVFPVPGGPTSSTPLGSLPPRVVKRAGSFKNSTTSISSFLACVLQMSCVYVCVCVCRGGGRKRERRERGKVKAHSLTPMHMSQPLIYSLPPASSYLVHTHHVCDFCVCLVLRLELRRAHQALSEAALLVQKCGQAADQDQGGAQRAKRAPELAAHARLGLRRRKCLKGWGEGVERELREASCKLSFPHGMHQASKEEAGCVRKTGGFKGVDSQRT